MGSDVAEVAEEVEAFKEGRLLAAEDIVSRRRYIYGRSVGEERVGGWWVDGGGWMGGGEGAEKKEGKKEGRQSARRSVNRSSPSPLSPCPRKSHKLTKRPSALKCL